MKTILALWIALASSLTFAMERPNILWLTSEDNSPLIGCYGDQLARTPCLDRLAEQGVRYTYAYANTPVCSVARTTLLTGMHAVSLGLHHHRSKYPMPDEFQTYPELLREAGYYCTNNAKTDYNIRFRKGRKLWDESSRKAHYKNRGDGQPFFAVFNFAQSHESQTFPANVKKKRQTGQLPASSRLNPSDVVLPPYHPDLPEIRREWADYYDCVSDMDRRVAEKLNELAELGLDDNTIVFYYSDHGGSLPRGKRCILETGTRVPLIIRFPARWQHLAPGPPGSTSDRLVSFVDFAPTVLSLCGIKIPQQMQGQPFLGSQELPPRNHVFLYRGRMDERWDEIRAVRTTRFRYVKNYSPHLPYGQWYSYTEDNSRITPAWRKHYEDGKCNAAQRIFWDQKPGEELYEVQKDPYELNNLVRDPTYSRELTELRKTLTDQIMDARDVGMIPEGMFGLAGTKTMFEFGREYPLPQLKQLADEATSRDVSHLPKLIKAMRNENALQRYWGALGCVVLGPKAADARSVLESLLDDDQPLVRTTAAQALGRMGALPDRATTVLINELEGSNDYLVNQALQVIEENPQLVGQCQDQIESFAKIGRGSLAGRTASAIVKRSGKPRE